MDYGCCKTCRRDSNRGVAELRGMALTSGTMKQVALLSAGCQPWNTDICAASGNKFAYCATLAIYVYQIDKMLCDVKLMSIMSEHKKTITGISWNCHNQDLFASCCSDYTVVVWNVAKQKTEARLDTLRGIPCTVQWCPHQPNVATYIHGRGPLYMWDYENNEVCIMKDTGGFDSNVCIFRWHPQRSKTVAFGHVNGSISIQTAGQRPQRHVIDSGYQDLDEQDSVTALEWDPLSLDYLLIANCFTGIRLIDSSLPAVLMKFVLPSTVAQVQTLAWLHSAPGMFITGDGQTGILRLWNVSKAAPIENIWLKKTGLHALEVLSGILCNAKSERQQNVSSSNQSTTIITSSKDSFTLPCAYIVCTFLDGGIGVYDLGKRRWNFLRDQGHVETIFDCKFKPNSPELLATASFDGTIKVWEVETLETVASSPGNEGVIYCISWAPADLNCIVACTSKNGVFIWDINKGKIVKRFNEHGKSSVYSVSWNQKDSQKIMSGGADKHCIIRLVDGSLVQKYKHPAIVYGCDWSPHNKDILATGCEDNCVRIFYLATNNNRPLKIFSGHTNKVFHVRWAPIKEGLLCSGSDDKTIRVWDYTKETCISVLSGHSSSIRGILWNTEIPYLLISGSWDSSIRVWDIRDGACIDTILDHGADVYGLASHPNRPFLLASCSRDSTLRLWSLTPIIQPLELNILARKPWSEIFGSTEHALDQGALPKLMGQVSKEIRQKLEKSTPSENNWIIDFSKLLSHSLGTSNLWELALIVKGMDESLLSDNYHKGIMHCKHLRIFKGAEAQEIEMRKTFSGGIGVFTKEESLREAASLHVRIGNLRRYCELMVEVNEWEKALCVAPGVSYEYWKTLARRYSKYLLMEDVSDPIPVCIATGQYQQIIDHFRDRGQYKDAVLAAWILNDGGLGSESHVAACTTGPALNGYNQSSSVENLGILQATIDQLADWYLRNGSATLAACCHLSVDNCEKALSCLLRGHELELAVSIGTVLGGSFTIVYKAKELLARRCERLGLWDLAVDLLKTIPDNELLLTKVCARCAASMDEINFLHEKAGFPSMDECLEKSEKLCTKVDTFKCIQFYMLSTTPEKGVQLGLEQVKGKMSTREWTVDALFETLGLLGCMMTRRLQQQQFFKMAQELQALCSYVGALVAMRRNYDIIVKSLLMHAWSLIEKNNLELPVKIDDIEKQVLVWDMVQTAGGCDKLSAEQKMLYYKMLKMMGHETLPMDLGPDYVVCSHLPSHSDIHISCLTGHRIQGQPFFLEDGISAISMNEALMWAKVNPFSPLGSAEQINPF